MKISRKAIKAYENPTLLLISLDKPLDGEQDLLCDFGQIITSLSSQPFPLCKI